MPPHVLDTITETLRREFEDSNRQAAEQARAGLLQTLNQTFRRFRAYQSEAEWVRITLDAAAPFGEVALFAVVGDKFQLRGQTPAGQLPDDLSIPASAARAFASALESSDPVTALCTAAEVSPAIGDGRPGERIHLFPISNGARTSALLFASSVNADMSGLELVASFASGVLERKANAAMHAQIAPAPPPLIIPPRDAATERPLPAASRTTALKLPDWGDLPADQRQAHLRAQRFARVAVAELQLSRPEACRAGREQGDLYLFLKREIDKARENFRKQFTTVPSMVDYLHLELVQVAAEGDEEMLGADYPGRLL